VPNQFRCRSSLIVIAALGIALAIGTLDASAQSPARFENVVLITLDGLRPEEVFTGADRRLMTSDNGVKNPADLLEKFWREDAIERREILLPFVWQQCQSPQGWIAGDLERDSLVTVTNGLYFSYPGYNEILTGAPDPRVNSNDKKYNENVTVLEWLNSQDAFRERLPRIARGMFFHSSSMTAVAGYL
jgi:hypothetical protein